MSQSSWNVVTYEDGYVLMNEDNTFIRLHGSIQVESVLRLFDAMESMDFPISHTKGVEEIYFTYLKNDLSDDYIDGEIRLSCGKKREDELPYVFVHEVGHHIDEKYGFSERLELIEEWKRMSSSFEHFLIKKEVCEYFACGLEKFYSGSLLTDCPVLLECCMEAHFKGIQNVPVKSE